MYPSPYFFKVHSQQQQGGLRLVWLLFHWSPSYCSVLDPKYIVVPTCPSLHFTIHAVLGARTYRGAAMRKRPCDMQGWTAPPAPYHSAHSRFRVSCFIIIVVLQFDEISKILLWQMWDNCCEKILLSSKGLRHHLDCRRRLLQPLIYGSHGGRVRAAFVKGKEPVSNWN